MKTIEELIKSVSCCKNEKNRFNEYKFNRTYKI